MDTLPPEVEIGPEEGLDMLPPEVEIGPESEPCDEAGLPLGVVKASPWSIDWHIPGVLMPQSDQNRLLKNSKLGETIPH